MDNGKVLLSQEIITQMKRLRAETRAESVCVKLYLAQNLRDYWRDYFELMNASPSLWKREKA